jgi:hypothetical protein
LYRKTQTASHTRGKHKPNALEILMPHAGLVKRTISLCHPLQQAKRLRHALLHWACTQYCLTRNGWHAWWI